MNVMYRYNKTVKVWLFRDTGCASGNKPGLGATETANIPYYYPYRAFGGQNKIVYSTRFVTRTAILLSLLLLLLPGQ